MCCFFSGVPGLRGRKHLRGVHRCGALLPCKSTRAISRQTSAAQGSLFDREVVIIRIRFMAYENDRTGRVKILLLKCVLFVVTFRKNFGGWPSMTNFVCCWSGGESVDSARGDATCVTLGTSVTTATTYSAIDEALSPACCTLLTVSLMPSRAQGVCQLTVPIVIETTVRGEWWEAYSKCEVFLSVLKSPSVSFVLLSHCCGHVQDAEAEVGFHDGAIFVGCKCTSFPCHFH